MNLSPLITSIYEATPTFAESMILFTMIAIVAIIVFTTLAWKSGFHWLASLWFGTMGAALITLVLWVFTAQPYPFWAPLLCVVVALVLTGVLSQRTPSQENTE